MKRSHRASQVLPSPASASVFDHQDTSEVWHRNEMLPDQFFTSTQESHGTWTGERLLLLAVLQEAVHTYLSYCTSRTRRGQRLFAQAQEWFLSHDQHYLYSFERI